MKLGSMIRVNDGRHRDILSWQKRTMRTAGHMSRALVSSHVPGLSPFSWGEASLVHKTTSVVKPNIPYSFNSQVFLCCYLEQQIVAFQL